MNYFCINLVSLAPKELFKIILDAGFNAEYQYLNTLIYLKSDCPLDILRSFLSLRDAVLEIKDTVSKNKKD